MMVDEVEGLGVVAAPRDTRNCDDVQDVARIRVSVAVVALPESDGRHALFLRIIRIVDRGAEEVLRVYEKTREDVAAIDWAG
jgi:hypothetical protein